MTDYRLEFRGMPNLFLLYLRALLQLFKPRWPKPETRIPSIEAVNTGPVPVTPSRLQRFKAVADQWQGIKEPQVPALFLISDTFRLIMAVMLSRHFPFRVLGSTVNKRTRYQLLKPLSVGERLLHRCKLRPHLQTTPGGHAEFEMVVDSHNTSGELVWQAVVTLVLLNPQKTHPAHKQSKVPAAQQPAAADSTALLLSSCHLPEAAGRQYAMLDGDISPMHMWRATARMFGFPRPVANVHVVMAQVEALMVRNFSKLPQTQAEIQAEEQQHGPFPLPLVLEGHFRRPVLLPATLNLRLRNAGAPTAATAAVTASINSVYFMVEVAKSGQEVVYGECSWG